MNDVQPGIRVRSGEGHGDGNGGFTDVIETIERSVTHHAGWQSVAYKGKRYQLFGGIRTDWFIDLQNRNAMKPSQR